MSRRKLNSTPPAKPVIMTEWGPVTEWARRQAAENILLDPVVRKRVEEFLTKRFGKKEGMERMREMYPEAFITQ